MKMKTQFTKQLLSIVLCLTLVLTYIPLTALAKETHSHPICGKAHTDIGDHTGACADITWTEWDSVNSMPTEAGAYYLDGDVTLSSSWEIPEGVEISLCLNGHSLSGNNAVRVVTINKTATLNLCDCSTAQTGKITEGYRSDYSGSGVWVSQNSTFNMYGGSIVQNETSYQGGGVYIFQGTFNMYGGSIFENTAFSGAGVNNNGGTISIYAGDITKNIASQMGGGVDNSGKFYMTGGTISANEVTGYQQYCHGGGVWHNFGTFEMSGGTISGNSAETGAGIYVAFSSKWLVSGTPAIHDAIYLNSSQFGTSYITVSGALNGGALFAATNRGVGETIVIGTDTYSITGNDAAKFATNEGTIYLDSVGNRLVLCNDSHPEYENGACKTCGAECEHSLVYESNQDAITERCNAESLCGHEEKATLSANLQIYSGSALTPATISYSDGWRGERVEDSAITYSQNTNVGTASASVEIEGKTITTTFEICPEHIESTIITLNPTSGDYNGTEQKPDISVSYGGVPLIENTDYTLSWDKSGLKNADIYTVTITGMGNFAYETQKTFDIKKKEIAFAWGGVNFLPYTGQLTLPEVTATNLADGDTCEVLVSVVETVDGAGINPGKWTARITGLSNENYKLPENSSVPLEVEYTIYAHQAAPDVSSVSETIKGKNDGHISGLTTEMEYATEPAGRSSAYTKITDPNMLFAPGTYYVRYAAKDYYYSSPDTVVTVAEGRMLTVTLPQVQEGYTLTVDKTEFAYNDSLYFSFTLHDGYTMTDDFSAKFNDMILPVHYGNTVVDYCFEDVVVTVRGVADITPPAAEIKVKENKWTSFWNNLTFGLFFKETQDVTINVYDAGSGVKSVQYYLSDRELEHGEVRSITDWIDYNGTFKINPDNRYVIYAKVTDHAGNVEYINSDGIVLDSTAPVLYGIEDGGVYHGDKVFKAMDENFLKIEVDGVDITDTTEGDAEFKIAADNAEHTVTVTDKAGNVTEYKITVYKKYMVTYTDGEGSSYEKNFNYGEVITIPTNEFFKDTFRKTGYTVKEWQGYTEGMTMPLKDLTFTAVYAPCEYTVTFDQNGGEAIDPITVTFGEKYGSLTSSAITGLSGGNKNWYLVDADGNVTETNIKNLTLVSTARDHKLFIKRNVLAPSVSVALTVPGGISDSYQYYIPGASQRILTANVGNMNTDILDYTYQWYKDGTAIVGATSNVLTLDGNVSDSGTYKVEVTATLKDGTNIVVTSDTATASKEQKVKILHATNTLSYDANGGEGGPQSSYTGGTALNVSKDLPTRLHYDFIGWNTAPDGTGDSYKAENVYTFVNDNGNGGCEVTLYAQWKLVEYTVTYMANGEPVATEKVEHGKDAALPAVPAKDGYVGKWDSDGKNITGDTTITAVYTAIPVVKPNEVKPEDKTDLEDVKAKLEEELKDDSYTDDDKKDIQDAIDAIDDALEVIGNVEAVEELIDKLSENITKNDEDAIKAADDAYNALSDYEKSLVDEDAKKTLDNAKAALTELKKPVAPNSPETGDNRNMTLWIALLFISGDAVITLTIVDRKRRMARKR